MLTLPDGDDSFKFVQGYVSMWEDTFTIAAVLMFGFVGAMWVLGEVMA